MPPQPSTASAKAPSLLKLLRPYAALIGLLAAMTLGAGALNLVMPQLIARAIDDYTNGHFALALIGIEFAFVGLFIFIFTYAQNIVQVFASERVARDLRRALAQKISMQPYEYIDRVTPAKLLTNLTSDVDSVKSFVSIAVASLISSFFLILGAAALMLFLNWRLGLAVLVVVPVIAVTFYFVLGRVRKLFVRSREAIDWLNRVISESILGAALIRLLNSQHHEEKKFMAANAEALDIGLSILRLFSSIIPVITLSTNAATLIILVFGGHLVIAGSMSLGDFTAFNSYLGILIFPIILIGFMSNVIARASASYGRIAEVLGAPSEKKTGGLIANLTGDIAVKNVTVRFGEKAALRDVSLHVAARSRTAVIGPTAAGKTQLLYLLAGLLEAEEGSIEYDGRKVAEWDKQALHSQVGFVSQDSVMFNLSIRENVAFNKDAKDEDIALAVQTAELHDFIDALPEGLETVVSERGSSLSGGQKQRVMLARALTLNPKVLLLDEFTARVDAKTEKIIFKNIAENYPNLTLVSVTQKIAPALEYDQIILLMEGEVLASGTHEELLEKSPEYMQIFESQKSTNQYELQA